MSFTSLWYFPVLGIVAVCHRFLDSRLKPGFLLAVSWLLYGLFGWGHLGLLLFVTGISYLTGILLEGRRKRDVFILASGVLIVAGVLFYVKYFAMALSWIGTAAGLLGRELTFSERYVILPVGISFYTFQALSYMVDVYRGGRKERSFIKYALYISFFPQLVAGPIEQAGCLIPQLTGKRASREDLRIGGRYLLSGCVRKFVIADYLAVFVDAAYGNVMQQSGISLLLATFFFAIQIYCDFSGYTHMAIGSARLLGIRLTENFDRPYLATGCRDFWKRWHITLTRWFTEYVYIPLGGNRKSAVRKYCNIMIVFLLSGLWHGADLTFLCWGAFFGIWRIAEELGKKAKGGKIVEAAEERTGKIRMQRLATFLLVCISWVIFRSASLEEAIEVLRRIFLLEGGWRPVFGITEMAGAALRVGILALLPGILKSGEAEENKGMKEGYLITVLLFLTAVNLLALFNKGGGSSFIYFQF